MPAKGFVGHREWTMLQSAKAQAQVEQARAARLEAMRGIVEGEGANYLKIVRYEGRAPYHVLIFRFPRTPKGEAAAEAIAAQTLAKHGMEMHMSVYKRCFHALRGFPVIGESQAPKGRRQRAEVARGEYQSERAAR